MSFDGMGRRDFILQHGKEHYRFVHFLSAYQNYPPLDGVWVVYSTTTEEKIVATFKILEEYSRGSQDRVTVTDGKNEITFPTSTLKEFVDKAYYLYQYEYTETLLLRVNKKLQNNELSIMGMCDLAECLKNLFNDLEI